MFTNSGGIALVCKYITIHATDHRIANAGRIHCLCVIVLLGISNPLMGQVSIPPELMGQELYYLQYPLFRHRFIGFPAAYFRPTNPTSLIPQMEKPPDEQLAFLLE